VCYLWACWCHLMLLFFSLISLFVDCHLMLLFYFSLLFCVSYLNARGLTLNPKPWFSTLGENTKGRPFSSRFPTYFHSTPCLPDITLIPQPWKRTIESETLPRFHHLKPLLTPTLHLLLTFIKRSQPVPPYTSSIHLTHASHYPSTSRKTFSHTTAPSLEKNFQITMTKSPMHYLPSIVPPTPSPFIEASHHHRNSPSNLPHHPCSQLTSPLHPHNSKWPKGWYKAPTTTSSWFILPPLHLLTHTNLPPSQNTLTTAPPTSQNTTVTPSSSPQLSLSRSHISLSLEPPSQPQKLHCCRRTLFSPKATPCPSLTLPSNVTALQAATLGHDERHL